MRVKQLIRAETASLLLPLSPSPEAVVAHEDVATLIPLEGQPTLPRGPRGEVPAGECLSGPLAERPRGRLIEAMPPAFRDALPTRLARLEARDVAPRPEPDCARAAVADRRRSERDARGARVPLVRGRAGDPRFRAALVDSLRYRGERDPALFPEKHRPAEAQ